MADETEVVVDTAPAPEASAVEAEARRGGWRPKEEWRGNPEVWVDAATFVKRGHELLPHISRANSVLRSENEQLKTQVGQTQAELAELKASVEALTKFRAETAARLAGEDRAALVAQLAAAKRAGDFEEEARITELMTRTPIREPQVERPRPTVNGGGAPQPGPAAIPQEMKEWVAQNDWYARDPVMQRAMTQVSNELRQRGDLEGMSLTDSLNYTAKEVLRRYAPAQGAGSRVEGGGRPAGGAAPGARRSGGLPTFEELPPDIQRECDAQGDRMGLIGEKKVFKTKEAWREHYIRETSRYSPNLPWYRERTQ